MLPYLEKKLGLIEMSSGQTLVRFVLDPLAEFYAAFFFFEEGSQDEQEWRNFVAFAREPANRQLCLGFCHAVVNVWRWNPVFSSRIPKSTLTEITAALEHVL
jgi:hypothetical protein